MASCSMPAFSDSVSIAPPLKMNIHSPNPQALLLRLVAFAALISSASAVPTTSYNTGSLGLAGDGANTAGVVVDQPGAIAAYIDYSSSYASGERTEVPFLPALNPAASSPFTIEFWAMPTASDNDDAPVTNRLGGNVNRSGWVFFQRAAGWNFRMYNGNGTARGWDLTGGTSTLNTWSHVVAVWDGSRAALYVNGTLASSTNAAGLDGVYNPNTTESLYLGALIGGGSPTTGSIDEVAFYPTALTAGQIAAHFTTASNNSPGAYSSMVLADGAIEYLQQNPPEAKFSFVAGNPTVTFTGILSQSPDLVNWTDLAVTSPYTAPAPHPGKLFFRCHR